jgi:VPDSG-CTERM motif
LVLSLLLTDTVELMKKYNILPVSKLALLTAVFCAAMFAFDQNASASRRPLPPVTAQQVPDGGTTIMLLGAAIGTLGIARRFLKR